MWLPLQSNGLKEVNTKKCLSLLEKLVCIFYIVVTISSIIFTNNSSDMWSSGQGERLVTQRSGVETSEWSDFFQWFFSDGN